MSHNIEMTNKTNKENVVCMDGENVSAAKETFWNNEEISMNVHKMMLPYILVGCPFNYCFNEETHSCVNSLPMKVYTIAVSISVHFVLLLWIGHIGFWLYQSKHLNNGLIEDIFILSYLFAGIIGLDIIWLNQKSIRQVFDLLDKPLPKKKSNEGSLSWKYILLTIASYILAASLLVFYGVIIYNLLQSYVDPDKNELPTRWLRTMRVITVYGLYFFVSDAVLLVSLIWSLKDKITDLNFFIKDMIDIEERPRVEDIENIKKGFQNILQVTNKIDASFSLYIPAFIGFLFFGIIYFVSKTIDTLNMGHAESMDFVYKVTLSISMSIALFYGLKELTDVHDLSSSTKSILYEYVLNTKPHERTTAFFEEINFVANGLLNDPASFTLLGQIKLDKNFLAKIIMVIYSYTIIFNQFERNIPNESTSKLK